MLAPLHQSRTSTRLGRVIDTPPDPLGLYLHVPFCAASCPYCDYPHVGLAEKTRRPDEALESFVEALTAEIQQRSRFHGAPVETIYLGGGTPSQLSGAQFAHLFEILRRAFDCTAVEEITVEANPDDLHPSLLRSLHNAGVNRLSLGVQSFFEDDLHMLGRRHDAAQAARAVPAARDAGFENVSIDLLFGLPGQSRARWQATLEKAVQQAPDHVTLYRLTAEPGTPLSRRIAAGAVCLPDDETAAAQYEQALCVLEAAGFCLVEQTHLARPGFEPMHTGRYWRHAPVLGFGPGAHSFYWKDDDTAVRRANTPALHPYVATASSDVPHSQESLAAPALADEYLALRLRTARGLSLKHLASRYGRPLGVKKEAVLDRLRTDGYVELRDDHLRVTRTGRLRLDALTAALL